ncbi:hypothetical protein B0T11DRAFT_298627 [Plectosphaerella cucumerina]|uniref:Uncharacterized protein n=1 Tax=Plectosphaerella cucumerina TaxID=40658 RepID=A0A8K0TF08_9PEZI|nr:hypothetical protein B0T11DRAFT_298627 [Plectosphaerella cucumerina]
MVLPTGDQLDAGPGSVLYQLQASSQAYFLVRQSSPCPDKGGVRLSGLASDRQPESRGIGWVVCEAVCRPSSGREHPRCECSQKTKENAEVQCTTGAQLTGRRAPEIEPERGMLPRPPKPPAPNSGAASRKRQEGGLSRSPAIHRGALAETQTTCESLALRAARCLNAARYPRLGPRQSTPSGMREVPFDQAGAGGGRAVQCMAWAWCLFGKATDRCETALSRRAVGISDEAGQGQPRAGLSGSYRSVAFIDGCADVCGGGQTLSATAQSSRSAISVSEHWTWEQEAKKVIAPGERKTDRREILRVGSVRLMECASLRQSGICCRMRASGMRRANVQSKTRQKQPFVSSRQARSPGRPIRKPPAPPTRRNGVIWRAVAGSSS